MTTRPTITDYLKCVLDVDELPEGFHRREKYLQRLVDEGVLVRHIATAAGVSENSVYKAIRRNDLKSPVFNYRKSRTKANSLRRTLESMDPHELGEHTVPDGDNTWETYYAEGEKGQ